MSQSFSQSFNQSISQSFIPSINRSISQSVSQSINQSISQSINSSYLCQCQTLRWPSLKRTYLLRTLSTLKKVQINFEKRNAVSRASPWEHISNEDSLKSLYADKIIPCYNQEKKNKKQKKDGDLPTVAFSYTVITRLWSSSKEGFQFCATKQVMVKEEEQLVELKWTS